MASGRPSLSLSEEEVQAAAAEARQRRKLVTRLEEYGRLAASREFVCPFIAFFACVTFDPFPIDSSFVIFDIQLLPEVFVEYGFFI